MHAVLERYLRLVEQQAPPQDEDDDAGEGGPAADDDGEDACACARPFPGFVIPPSSGS